MRQEIHVTSVHLHTEQEGGDLGLKKRSQFFPCVVTVPLSLLSALVRRPGKLLISPLYILFSQVDLEKKCCILYLHCPHVSGLFGGMG